MDIFDEPSKKPLPKTPDLYEVRHVALKAVASLVPGGSELVGLLTSPLAQRRDDWFEDLERRLRDLEGRVEGFRFDDLRNNEQFISATLQATQAAIKTHQKEKLEALRNAVLNVAIGQSPGDDLQLIFLTIIDAFTPKHLQVLRFLTDRNQLTFRLLVAQRELVDPITNDLHTRGLVKDPRPLEARNGYPPTGLLAVEWELTQLGRQFLEFVGAPDRPRT